MAKSYRNEYFYKNTLINKILLGKYSTNTATALTQISIGKSKADLILINGKAIVFEIKTELDTFERLNTQLRDYYKAFTQVCVVTSEGQYSRARDILKDSPVGIYVLTARNTISTKLRKEPFEETTHLSHVAMFKVLHKSEYEKVLLQYYKELPNTSQVLYYGECLRLFSQIPILEAYKLYIRQLKNRNRIIPSEFNSIPYELKSLVYFSKQSDRDWKAINGFLNKQFGG